YPQGTVLRICQVTFGAHGRHEKVLCHNAQAIVQKAQFALLSLNFPARSSRQRSRGDQHNAVSLDFILFNYTPANGVNDFCRLAPGFPIDLTDNNKPLLFGNVNRECCASMAPQSLVGYFNGLFDVLGIEVPTANNDAVLQPASDVKFAVLKKSVIACSQIA